MNEYDCRMWKVSTLERILIRKERVGFFHRKFVSREWTHEKIIISVTILVFRYLYLVIRSCLFNECKGPPLVFWFFFYIYTSEM